MNVVSYGAYDVCGAQQPDSTAHTYTHGTFDGVKSKWNKCRLDRFMLWFACAHRTHMMINDDSNSYAKFSEFLWIFFLFLVSVRTMDMHTYWHTPAAMNVSRRKKKKQNEMREKITESTHTRLLLSKAPLRRTHFSLQANCIQCGAVRSDHAIAQNKNMYTQRDGRPSAAMNRRSNTVCVLRLLHLRHSFYLSCQRFGWKITRGYSYKRRQECIKCRTRLINTQVTTCIVVDRQKT